MTTDDIIKRLPFELAARAQADDYFCDIPVAVAEEGNISLAVDLKQIMMTIRKDGKRGVGVIVPQMQIDDIFPNLLFGPALLKPAFQIVENVELNNQANGIKKSARQVGRRLRDIFKNKAIIGLTKAIMVEENFMIPVNLDPKLYGDQVKAYQVNFMCEEGSADDNPQQVAAPVILMDGVAVDPTNAATLSDAGQGLLTFTCATAGAKVWFTLDDTYPVPLSVTPTSTAKLFNGDAVQMQQGKITIRAGAYLAGSIASNINRASITLT